MLTKVGTDTTALRFTHDAWNRLVKVEFEELDESGSPPHVPDLFPRGEYEYNGLNFLSAPADHSGSAVAPSVCGACAVRRFDSNSELELDTEQVLLYDADWRLIERRVNSAYDPEDEDPEIDRITHHVWGLRYIDDIVATRHDINTSAENGHELIFFHVTDAQFSTVAMLSATGGLLERVTYTAYGVARHHRAADVTGDGAVDSADYGLVALAFNAEIGDTEYRSEFDFNRDGTIDGADTGLLFQNWGAAEPDGVLSGPGVNNEIGYAGYQFAPEAGNLGAYLARNRWLDPELGRWRQRDPLGYVDGMNLYQYVGSSPRVYHDPHATARRACSVGGDRAVGLGDLRPGGTQPRPRSSPSRPGVPAVGSPKSICDASIFRTCLESSEASFGLVWDTWSRISADCGGDASLPTVRCCTDVAGSGCRGGLAYYDPVHNYICICTTDGPNRPVRIRPTEGVNLCIVLLEELTHAWQYCQTLPAGVDESDRILCMEIGAKCRVGGEHQGRCRRAGSLCRRLCEAYKTIPNCADRCCALREKCSGFSP